MHQNPAITFVLRQNPFCRISHRPNAISPISLFGLERKFQLTMKFFIKATKHMSSMQFLGDEI